MRMGTHPIIYTIQGYTTVQINSTPAPKITTFSKEKTDGKLLYNYGTYNARKTIKLIR